MKAVGFKTSLNITDENSFVEFELPIPKPTGYDLLIKIKAVAVNPVDYKIRLNSAKDIILEDPKIIGWDAVGIVEEVGDSVSLFKVGDEVFYAGDITRPGCNAAYQLVDERIAGRKPANFSYEATAAMPLTSLTAWEILFDRMKISLDKDAGKSILIIGGAGGVGSIAIQLAKKIGGLKVVATASRPKTRDWCLKLGADAVIDHTDLIANAQKAGYPNFDYIADFVDLNAYWDVIVELIKPQGHIASITGSNAPIALNKLKTKSVSFSWEFMFTRPMFKTEDMIAQHHILTQISELMQKGVIKSAVNTVMNGLSVGNLKEAHRQLESGKTIGKIVILF
ncbi:zinc-binding alcohol dehydrogenase family protein [Pedobacter arcticus]|uniref:zinc-binding alcohol dehydrogenase family protein n=1 Tax=Pedobacter arcticus TaxID=752140 RepID=UPI0003008B56|nr:zinc-binding alcohol dehydrogenase family protein [Pedobacter arcticus]